MDEARGQSDLRSVVARRRAMAIDSNTEQLVRFAPLTSNLSWLALATPATPGVRLADWAAEHRIFVRAELLRWGAILFRGFGVTTVPSFQAGAYALGGELIEYRFRASPRHELGERIYTSTDYPAEQTIFPHNEHAYSSTAPRIIVFGCIVPPTSGGATTLGDNRAITGRIPRSISQRFVEKGVLYERNYREGFGLPWQTVFQTEDRRQVEAYCGEHGIMASWRADGGLTTRQIGPAFVRHPADGRVAWFNHATFFHVSTLGPSVSDALIAGFGGALPQQTFYGDGSPIENAVLEQLRAIYMESLFAFPWEAGDVLLVDNVNTVHGRDRFEGKRQVAVAMAEPFSIHEHAEHRS